MPHRSLNLVGNPARSVEGEEVEEKLIDDLHGLVSAERNSAIEKFREWITYSTKQGARKLYLDEGPGILASDQEFIIAWLREQGLTVTEPRGLAWLGMAPGRVTITIP